MEDLERFSNVLRELIKKELADILPAFNIDQPEFARFFAALQKVRFIAVYPFGSRLYGTNDPDSDWDFLMVATNLYRAQRECEVLLKIKCSTSHKHTLVKVLGELHFNGVQIEGMGQADLAIYDEVYWRELLQQNVNFILCCSFLPPELVPFYKQNYKFDAVICKPKLYIEVLSDMNRNLWKARQYFKTEELRKAKKRLIHILRYTHYTIQLMRNGQIVDITEGNQYWAEIEDSSNFPKNDWAEYQSWFKYYFNKLYKIMEKLAESPNFSIEPDPLATITYVRDHGISALERDFNVKVVKSNDTFKIFTSYFVNEIPNCDNNPIYKECFGGLCIKKLTGEEENFRILAYSFPAFEKDKEGSITKPFTMDPKDCYIYEKLDGRTEKYQFLKVKGFLVTMYWGNGRWELLVNPEIIVYFLGQQQTYKKRGLRPLTSSYSGKNRSEDICNILFQLEILDENSLLKNFSDIFWNLWHQLGYQLPKQQQYCYMFEILHTFYRVIVPQERSRIVCTGVRNLATLQEENFHELANQYNWETVQPLTNISTSTNSQEFVERIRQVTHKLKPWESEGFIVFDRKKFTRRKFVSIGYTSICEILVAMNKFPKESEESYLERFLILVLLFGDHGNDICTYFTELQAEFYTILQKVNDVCDTVNLTFMALSKISDPKEYADTIKISPYQSLLFLMKKTNLECQDVIHHSFHSAFSTWKKLLFK